ncbi:ATP-binding protein [Streptomyces pathocidini]|uniref:ATP-binding protein n=1 Tax=Streptomyces pathocidini TaxID=1650571 RepID=UPI0033F3F3AD
MNEETQHPYLREWFLPRDRRSVPVAREFAQGALLAWKAREREEEVLLCVSELATNALLHGVPPGRGFKLGLTLGADGAGPLRVEVHDSGEGCPRIPDAGEGDESGRGLLLVETLADKWGITERALGKVVWCEFAT